MSALAVVGAQVARLDRRPLPHRVILWAIPLAVRARFDAGAAGDLSAVFELRVRDARGSRFVISVHDRACEVRRGDGADATAALTAGADDLVRMVSGAAAWPSLLSSGRLQLTGDPFLALRFPVLFRLPATGPLRARTPSWARRPRTRRSSPPAATS